MPEYRRMDAPGGTFFLTLVTYERTPLFTERTNVELPRTIIGSVQRERPFAFPGAVILPDHLHLIWELPAGDTDFSTRVGLLKARFTKALGDQPATRGRVSASRRRHRERFVWQRRFWEHTIRDEEDFETHMDYMHYNPVKHGLARCPHAWPYSSFHHWVRAGRYPADWCCTCAGPTVAPPEFDHITDRVGE
jgi:putative transposase